MDIKDGTTKLTFKYKLSGTTATAYSIYALTLYEQDVELNPEGWQNNTQIINSIWLKLYNLYHIKVMTKYYSYGVSLSKGQLEKLSRAYNNNSAITIKLARNELSGPHELMLTKTQIYKLKKAMSQGTGSDIKISKTQIRKAITHGGSLWGSLISLGSKLLPMAMPLAKKAIAPLATGVLSGLTSLRVDKMFGKGRQGGFLIPQDKIAQLIKYKHLLSVGQKNDILNHLQSGGQLVIKPTRTQQGGFSGTLLASIGAPLLLNALTGKGLQADRTGTFNTMSLYVPNNTTNGHGMINPYPYMLPPFFGTWNHTVGIGIKKKEEERDCCSAKTVHSIPILGTIL